MASRFQSPPWARYTTTTASYLTLALVACLTLCSGAHQGCHLHPQEKLISCRGVTSIILQEFLVHVNATIATTSTTTTSTTATTPTDSITLPLPNSTTATEGATTRNITLTTKSPSTPDNTTDINTTISSPPAPSDNGTTFINTTQAPTQQQESIITTAATATESESDDSIKDGNTASEGYDAAGITELSCVGCRLPRLTLSLLGTPVTLERLFVVDSGVEAIVSGALTSHAPTLVHLDLSYNLLRILPKDVGSLTRLQVLDLRHNKILEVADGARLTSLHSLRHLHLDDNKLGQTLTSSRSQGSQMSVFDLWAKTALRLSHLGLSHNGITEVPDEAFSSLSSLLVLDLSDNLLSSLRPSTLPPSVLELDLRGNPWNCTCAATWILERHSRLPPTPSFLLSSTPPISSTSILSPSPAAVAGTTILSPTCSSPLHLQRRLLDSLTVSEVCPLEEDAAEDEVVYIGDDVEGILEEAFSALRLLNVTSLTTHALLVSWRVDAAFYAVSSPPREPLSWVVTIREASKGSRESHVTRLSLDRYRREQPHWTPGNGLFAEVLEGLREATGYVVCLTVEQQHRLYTHPGHCLHGSTLTSVTSRSAKFLTPADVPSMTPEVLQSYSTQDYGIHTAGFTVWAAESRSASLSWNVTVELGKGKSSKNLLLRPIGWRVTYRRFESEEDEEVTLISRGGEPLQNFTNHYSIQGLQPGTGYMFCLHTLTEEEVQKALVEDGAEIDSLSWQTRPFIQSVTAPGRSVTDSEGEADGKQPDKPDDALPPSQHTPTTVSPTLQLPESRMPLPDSGGDSIFSAPAAGSNSAIVHNPPPQPSSIPSSSNIPPPPILPTLPANRPPRPRQPDSGGGFVYTSTGLRIPLPSGSSGPYNVPPPIPVSGPGPRRGLHPEPPLHSHSRQRYIYEFDKTSASPPSTPSPMLPSSSKRQIYTYPTRRRREVAGSRPPLAEAASLCRQVVTPAELDAVLPAAIAGTVSCAATVVVVLVVCCCCWPRRCCRRKGAWRARSTNDSRKVSTISAPTPVTVFSTYSSEAGRGGGDGTASRGEDQGVTGTAGRTVSATTSSGYLMPLHSPDNRDQHSQNPDPKAAYLSLMQSRLMQKHKDLPEFHPGYDIPPMASTKSLVGYDYPHPTPVNPIGSSSGVTQKPAPVSPPVLPSPSSSDSNYNMSVGNSPGPERSPTEVNLNIPCQQLKSSALTKSVHVRPDAPNTSDCNYINPKEAPIATAVRTYLKHPPPRNHNRRFEHPQSGTTEHGESLSRSTPDLASTTTNFAKAEAAVSSTKFPVGKDHLSAPASLPPAASSDDQMGYINLPEPQKVSEDGKKQESPVNRVTVNERGTFNTWSGHTAKPRPSVGDVVLTGGTLIEVPEGYVKPQTPKPTPYIRLLVRGQDAPKGTPLDTPSLTPAHTEGQVDSRQSSHGSGKTHLFPSGANHNRLLINMAPAS